jgi:hypothetical protein
VGVLDGVGFGLGAYGGNYFVSVFEKDVEDVSGYEA